MFLNYGQDEIGYNLFGGLRRKLSKANMLCLWETKTILDIDKTEKMAPQYNDELMDLKPVPQTPIPRQIAKQV